MVRLLRVRGGLLPTITSFFLWIGVLIGLLAGTLSHPLQATPISSEEVKALSSLLDSLKKKESLEQHIKNDTPDGVSDSHISWAKKRPLPQLTDLVKTMSFHLFLFVKEVESQFVKYVTSLRHKEVRNAVLKAVGTILGVVFAGLFGEGLFYLATRSFDTKLATQITQGRLSKSEIFWIRGSLSLVPILIFTSFAALALIWSAPDPLTREIILLLVLAAGFYKVGARTSNLLFNPQSPPLRLLSLTTATAQKADRQFRFCFLAILGLIVLIDSMLVLETNTAMMTLVVKICITILYLMTLRFILKSRPSALHWIEKHLAHFQQGADHWSEVLIRHFWHRWHLIASLYLTVLAAAFLLSSLNEYPTLLWDFVELTFILLGGYILIFFIPEWMEKVSDAVVTRVPGLKSRKKFYVDFLATVAIMLSLATMLLLAGFAWDVNFLQGVLDGAQASLYIVTTLSILLIIFLGVVFWESIEYLMIGVLEPFLKKRANAEDKQRIETLVPIVRMILKILTVVVVVMMIFSELDLNITPILALFASLGIAVGLGGQKLAQDVITGTFILAENALSVGDIVEINGYFGKVEKTTLRTVNIRNADGSFYSIPYGSITAISNTSKIFSKCLFNVLVAYEYDYDRVSQVLKEADAEIRRNPHFSSFIKGEFVFGGIQALEAQGYTIRASVKVSAGKQWILKREYHRLFKKYFDENGIQHPYDRQNIVISNLSDIGPILEGETYTKTPSPPL